MAAPPLTGSLTSLLVDNGIFGSDARRRAIDDAVRAAFQRVAGAWTVTIRELTSFSPPRWWLNAEGGDAFELCLRPVDQSPVLVRERLEEALRARNLI
jgi:hypothetical protein